MNLFSSSNRCASSKDGILESGGLVLVGGLLLEFFLGAALLLLIVGKVVPLGTNTLALGFSWVESFCASWYNTSFTRHSAALTRSFALM